MLAHSGFTPLNGPVEFHWYAAEEGGLLGSQHVARYLKESGATIGAMMEFVSACLLESLAGLGIKAWWPMKTTACLSFFQSLCTFIILSSSLIKPALSLHTRSFSNNGYAMSRTWSAATYFRCHRKVLKRYRQPRIAKPTATRLFYLWQWFGINSPKNFRHFGVET